VITVHGLVKRYGDVLALQDLSLKIPEGSIFGILGPNGAGKTTLIRLIMRLIFPDRGEIEYEDCSPHQLGYLPERPHFPGRFRIEEYLATLGQLGDLAGHKLRTRIAAGLAQTGLSPVADRRISACSKGMLQRLGLAQALLTDPPILLLDEPFSGLDPSAQATMRQLVVSLNEQGKTVVLSTHQLADVSQICTHIAILAGGRLATSGPLAQALAPRRQVRIEVDRLPDLVAWQLSELHPELVLEDLNIILVGESAQVKANALRLLLDARIDIIKVEQQGSTLEEIYLDAVDMGPSR
jgi:ABC-2 type transport system ATP-binding protein